MNTRKYVMIVEPAADGSYSGFVPDLPGCTSCGETVDELRRNMRQAVAGHLSTLREFGEPVPPPTCTAEEVEVAA